MFFFSGNKGLFNVSVSWKKNSFKNKNTSNIIFSRYKSAKVENTNLNYILENHKKEHDCRNQKSELICWPTDSGFIWGLSKFFEINQNFLVKSESNRECLEHRKWVLNNIWRNLECTKKNTHTFLSITFLFFFFLHLLWLSPLNFILWWV